MPSTIESVCVLQTQGLTRLGGRCTLGVKHGDRTRNDRFRCFYCSLSVPDGDLALGPETPGQWCLCLCFFVLGQGGAGVRLPFLLLLATLSSLFCFPDPSRPVPSLWLSSLLSSSSRSLSPTTLSSFPSRFHCLTSFFLILFLLSSVGSNPPVWHFLQS